MKLNLIVIIAVLMGSWTAFATDTAIPRQKSQVLKSSSEGQRLNNTWTVQYQPFGSGPSGGSEKALIAGYFLDRNSILQAELGFGPTKGNSIIGDVFAIESPTVGLHYKKFFGNSFYAKVGGDYRYVDYYHDYDYDTGEKESFQGQSFAVSMTIGNQWQWANFTMGCDWIGFSAPVYSNVISESYAGNSGLQQDSLNDSKKKLLQDPVLQGLRFYVGYTF